MAHAFTRTVLAATLAGAATNATAQSPQVGTGKEISRTPYQQYTFRESCPNLACGLDFAPVPANSRLEITNVSCFLKGGEFSNVTPTFLVPQLLVVDSCTGAVCINPGAESIVSGSTLVPTLLGRRKAAMNGPVGQFDETIWTLNHAVQVFAETGQIFRAWFEIEGNPPSAPFPGIGWKFIGCHISGHLVKLQ